MQMVGEPVLAAFVWPGAEETGASGKEDAIAVETAPLVDRPPIV